MDEIKAKQQVVEKIKESAKILVTVSDNPSVDALSAALGLTLLLDKQEKYATAIFSGETPPAIAFLEPEKTFDDTTDSLRDFIIALNKEKADHLRYKVEGDSVKIFITPYKTVINQDDLEFSQGDYNVELVIALGVDNQESLDKALDDHGQILHDATIITMTAGEQSSDLGGIDWHDANASSLSEMVAGLAEALKVDKKKSLLDTPIATTLLTGIVAQTDRFSNEHTTSKVMTVAASLMSAGADQQLIATELQNSQEITPAQPEAEESDVEVDQDSDDGSMTIKKDPTNLSISHEGETLADLDRRILGDEKAKEKVIEEIDVLQENAAAEEAAEEIDEKPVVSIEETPTQEAPVEEAPVEEAPRAESLPETPVDDVRTPAYALVDEPIEPTLGGTLNATTEQAAEDARHEVENDQNKTILSHAYLGSDAVESPSPLLSNDAPVNHTPVGFPGAPAEVPGSTEVNDLPAGDSLHSAYAVGDMAASSSEPAQPAVDLPPSESPAIGGERVIQPLSQSVEPTPAPVQDFNTTAYAPEPAPIDMGLPLPPPLPDFSQGLTPPPALPLPATQQPEILGDIFAEQPPAVVPPIPELPQPQQPEAPQPPASPQSSDPAQFQIPNQS